jgi:hypothetical protein
MKFEIAPKKYEIKANWDDARLYCFALNIDGKTGWRLPTKNELIQIHESDNNFSEFAYWSSDISCKNHHWVINVEEDLRYYGDDTLLHWIRPVRDLKDNSLSINSSEHR